MLIPIYQIPRLPPPVDFESVRILKALNRAGPAIAYLKGQAEKIPNQGILIDTLTLQEAKASSEIENLVSTQDELFQADAFPNERMSPETKEVALYRDALHLGYTRLQETDGLIPNSSLIYIYRLLKSTDGEFRVTSGTSLKNEQTGETIYVPPQDAHEITEHMSVLERFVNEDSLCDLDPLIKMALIHHQFESIHPFSDGNGRIGRILNVLYLVRKCALPCSDRKIGYTHIISVSVHHAQQGKILSLLARGPRPGRMGGLGGIHAGRRGGDVGDDIGTRGWN